MIPLSLSYNVITLSYNNRNDYSIIFTDPNYTQGKEIIQGR